MQYIELNNMIKCIIDVIHDTSLYESDKNAIGINEGLHGMREDLIDALAKALQLYNLM